MRRIIVLLKILTIAIILVIIIVVLVGQLPELYNFFGMRGAGDVYHGVRSEADNFGIRA